MNQCSYMYVHNADSCAVPLPSKEGSTWIWKELCRKARNILWS